jgi:hypothetical protein
MTKSKLVEMNNVGIVVENLDNAIKFFNEIGLELEGRMMVEGEWAGRANTRKYDGQWNRELK